MVVSPSCQWKTSVILSLTNVLRHTPVPVRPRRPWIGSDDVRTAAGTSASAASGTMNEFSSNFSSSLISSGNRLPGSTVTAKTSCTAVSNRRSADACPAVKSITQTPQVRCSSVSRSVIGMPLKTAVSRTWDKPDKGEIAGEVDAPRESGHLGDRHILSAGHVDVSERASPDSQTQSRPAYQRGECGIDSPRVITSPESTSITMPPWPCSPPAGRLVGLAQRRHVPRAAIDHAQAVQVAAVRRLQRRDKRRPPPRLEAGRAVDRAQAREPGVDDPELVACTPGHLMDLDVAGDMAGARQEAGVVLSRPVELGRHRRNVDELPDLDLGAEGQPVAG